MPSIVTSGEASGEGKLDRASKKGGMLLSSAPLPGLIDRMPTIMIGTIRPSPPVSSFESVLVVPLTLLPLLSEVPPLGEPNLNIRKKLRGAEESASEPSTWLRLSASATLPF